MYHPESGEVGKESVKIASAELSTDHKTIKLVIPNIRPVNQLHLLINLKDEEGNPFSEEIYWTIHRLP
jgi:hypothetical protein